MRKLVEELNPVKQKLPPSSQSTLEQIDNFLSLHALQEFFLDSHPSCIRASSLCLNGETIMRLNCFPHVGFEDILVSPRENYFIFDSSNRKRSNCQRNNRKLFAALAGFFRIHNDNCEASESEQMNIGSQRILVSDHINTYQYSSEKVDSFVIDMDSFSSSINKDITNANSRTTKSLSRKGSQHWGDRNVNGNVTPQDKNTVPTKYSLEGTIATFQYVTDFFIVFF
ncbi:hypothetical protein QL285_005545 [Trifolium repens]|nr:hypothetical protein QL285_005545 [Trifolium repens]